MHCTTLPYAIHLGWRPNNGFNRKYRVNILHNILLEIVLCRCACLRVCVWKRIQWQYCVEWMNRIVSENHSHTVGYNRTYIFKITIRIVVDGGERVYHFHLTIDLLWLLWIAAIVVAVVISLFLQQTSGTIEWNRIYGWKCLWNRDSDFRSELLWLKTRLGGRMTYTLVNIVSIAPIRYISRTHGSVLFSRTPHPYVILHSFLVGTRSNCVHLIGDAHLIVAHVLSI